MNDSLLAGDHLPRGGGEKYCDLQNVSEENLRTYKRSITDPMSCLWIVRSKLLMDHSR